MQNILNFIEMLRSLYPQGYQEMSGGCLKFASILVSSFPFKWKLYINKDHVIVGFLIGLDWKFYDKDGEVKYLQGFIESVNNLDLIWQFRDVLSKADFKFCLDIFCRESR